MNASTGLRMTSTTQRQGSFHRRPRRVAGVASSVVAATVLLGLVSGCGGSAGGGSSSSSAVGRGNAVAKAPSAGDLPGAPEQSDSGSGSSAAGGAVDGKSAVAAPVDLLQNRRLVLNTSVELTVPSVFSAAARVRALASAAGGYVGDEKTAGSGATAQSAMTLRVPQAQLGQLTDQVAGLGKVTSRSQTSEDVTQQSIDVASRLTTQKASVARIRALLAQATRIADIVAIEGELSQRESNLESLEAQLKSLNDAVDLSTLSVILSAQGAPKKPAKDDTGFLAGLNSGWDAFVGALVVGLTVVGALLPFAVVLLLLGIPALVLWRRRRTVVPPAPAAVAEAQS
jgi:hypothetical protein